MSAIIKESDLTPQQAEFWSKAKQAIDLNNDAYAINIIKAIVKQAPGFLEGRKTLRACEIKLNPTPKKKGFFSGVKLSAGKKDPLPALADAEDTLEKDPFNPEANEQIFHAACDLDMPELADFALEIVRQGHPDEKKCLHLLADHYLTQEKYAEASEVFHDIIKADPSDSSAVKLEKDCMAKATMQQQKWDQAQSFRDVMKNSSETNALDKGDKQGLTRTELEERLGQLSAQYAQNNTSLAIVRAIAGVYEQMEDWTNAQAFYDYAFSLSGSDVSLKTKATDMAQNKRKSEMDEIKRLAAENPDDPALQARMASVTKELSAQQVADCRARVESNPTDPQTRFDLGLALFEDGQFTEAIPELQRARNNPFLRNRAMLMLGKCYKSKGMNDMALSQLKEANKELLVMDDTKMEVLYLMGQINEKLGDKPASLECFKQIYDANYGYRDVAKRVESSYAG